MMSRRHLLFSGLLIATLIAAIFSPGDEVPLLTKTEFSLAPKDQQEVTKSVQVPQSAEDAGLKLLPRALLAESPRELFRIDSPPSIKAKYVAPVAPPLPYVYMGKLLDMHNLTIFLSRGDRPYAVHEGDTLDAEYRVDSISGSVMELTYLPLNQKQTLNIGVIK